MPPQALGHKRAVQSKLIRERQQDRKKRDRERERERQRQQQQPGSSSQAMMIVEEPIDADDEPAELQVCTRVLPWYRVGPYRWQRQNSVAELRGATTP